MSLDQGGPFERLDSALYDVLRSTARRYLRARASRLVDPTEIVHEAYLRLGKVEHYRSLPEREFMALAARAMRHVLIDMARKEGAGKRGGELQRVTLRDVAADSGAQEIDLLALDEALAHLASRSPLQARVVELLYFGRLSLEQAAEVVGLSRKTASKEWRLARAWLFRELTGPSTG